MREWQHYDNVFVKAVFIDLLLSATAKPCWSCGIRLTRGQTLRSSRKIEEDNKISRPTVLRALRTLEESGEIVREKISQKLVKTTIVNYSKYQDINFVSGKNETPQRLPQRLPQSLPLTTREQENNSTNNKERNAHEEILNWLVNSQYLEQFAMSEGITPELCKKLANDAVMEWNMLGTTHRSVTDARKHMLDRIRKQVGVMRKDGTLKATEDMAKRTQPLIDGCAALVNKGHPKAIVARFYKDSTQLANDSTGRMKFEALGFWDTEYRFNEFLNREKK